MSARAGVRGSLAAISVASGLLLPGCTPGYSIRGRVHEPTACTEGADARRPVSGAKVTLRCPGGTAHLSAESTADGSFASSQIGVLPNNCDLMVEKPGYLPRIYAVGDLCAVYVDGVRCTSVALDANLTPVPRRGSTVR